MSKYKLGELKLSQLSFITNEVETSSIVIYTKSSQASLYDFTNPIQGQLQDNQLNFKLPAQKTRTLRIYFGKKETEAYIANIKLFGANNLETLSYSQFTYHNLKIINKSLSKITFSGEENAYLELKSERINAYEFLIIETVILLTAVLMSLLLLSIIPNTLELKYSKINFKVILVGAFFASIFLPPPIFNVAFISSFIVTCKDFNYRKFTTNKSGLLVVLYFLLFMINNVFVSETFNFKLTETLIPVLLIPFYIAAIPKINYFHLFPTVAFLLSLYFLSTSLVDAIIYSNPNYFSFDAFTKYLHPIYFSYLLFFSVIYIELINHESFNKKLFLPILLLSLICCGSKLIISLTIIFYFFRFLKKQLVFGSVVIIISISAILLFPPTKKRFQEVVDFENLSILSENRIKSFHDSRLNGLTLRLIIWQESLSSLTSFNDVLFGKGVDKTAEKLLENKLALRGLEPGHTKYDPHNQFIATYYKMGVTGLFCLLFICIYLLYYSYKQKNVLLIYSMVLFIAAMLTESVLQRIVGIYFFICILLLNSDLITNSSSQYVENSDTGNQRDSE